MFRIIPRQGVYHFKGYFRNLFNKKINVSDFEKKLAEYLDVRDVIAVGSATLSFYLILNNIKKHENDDVILAGYNYYDLVNVIKHCEMKPVFAEIDAQTLKMDLKDIKNKITKNTRAILVTHSFGFFSDIKEILRLGRKNNIVIIEDCSHCIGCELENRKIGSFGDFSIFSFNKWKVVDCLGGGAIASNNIEIMKKIRDKIKDYKLPNKIEISKRLFFNYTSYVLLSRKVFGIFVYPIIYFFDLFGRDILADLTKDNFSVRFSDRKKLKFTDFQARIGWTILDYLDEINKKIGDKYNLLFDSLKENKYKIKNGMNPIVFPIRVQNKKVLHRNLLRKGIDTTIKYYGYSLDKKNLEDDFILLPIHNSITKKDISYIADILNNFKLK